MCGYIYFRFAAMLSLKCRELHTLFLHLYLRDNIVTKRKYMQPHIPAYPVWTERCWSKDSQSQIWQKRAKYSLTLRSSCCQPKQVVASLHTCSNTYLLILFGLKHIGREIFSLRFGEFQLLEGILALFFQIFESVCVHVLSHRHGRNYLRKRPREGGVEISAQIKFEYFALYCSVLQRGGICAQNIL